MWFILEYINIISRSCDTSADRQLLFLANQSMFRSFCEGTNNSWSALQLRGSPNRNPPWGSQTTSTCTFSDSFIYDASTFLPAHTKLHPKYTLNVKALTCIQFPPKIATQNTHPFATTNRDVFSAHDVISLGPPEQSPRLLVSCGGEGNDHLPRTSFEGAHVRHVDLLFHEKVERPWNRQTQPCWLFRWNSHVSCNFGVLIHTFLIVRIKYTQLIGLM